MSNHDDIRKVASTAVSLATQVAGVGAERPRKVGESDIKKATATPGITDILPRDAGVAALSLHEQVFKRASQDLPFEVEHPFAHYWLNRVGGTALGGASAGYATHLATGRKNPLMAATAGLAGAFVGQTAGEVKSLAEHATAIRHLDAMRLPLPDAVRHPHLYGPAAHAFALRMLKGEPPVES